jgi:hypothetical protein
MSPPPPRELARAGRRRPAAASGSSRSRTGAEHPRVAAQRDRQRRAHAPGDVLGRWLRRRHTGAFHLDLRREPWPDRRRPSRGTTGSTPVRSPRPGRGRARPDAPRARGRPRAAARRATSPARCRGRATGSCTPARPPRAGTRRHGPPRARASCAAPSRSRAARRPSARRGPRSRGGSRAAGLRSRTFTSCPSRASIIPAPRPQIPVPRTTTPDLFLTPLGSLWEGRRWRWVRCNLFAGYSASVVASLAAGQRAWRASWRVGSYASRTAVSASRRRYSLSPAIRCRARAQAPRRAGTARLRGALPTGRRSPA